MGKMIDLKSSKNSFPVYVPDVPETVKGGIVVIHEVWGLTDHIKDVADKFAKEGYYVIAPDLLSEIGVPEKLIGELQRELFDPEKRAQAQPKLRSLMAPIQAPEFAVDTLSKLEVCFDYLYEAKETQQKVAVIGYCFGGSYSFSLAVNEPRLKAAIPFYGHADFSEEELKKIKSPILAFYGGQDERLMEALPKLKADMQKSGVSFSAQVYPDCGHAFFNDTNPYTYNEIAAKDSMVKALAFLDKSLA